MFTANLLVHDSAGGEKTAPAHFGRAYKLDSAEQKKGGSLLVNVLHLDKPHELATTGMRVLRVLEYANGCVVKWPLERKQTKPSPREKKRQIGDMSMKSRLEAAFNFGNAPFPWEWMITLTRRVQPENPKRDFDKFTRALRSRWDCHCQWGWIMEYQSRRVVHHHIFLSSDFVNRNFRRESIRYRTVTRHGRETSLVDGDFNRWVVSQWIAACGDKSEAFRRFQSGGIIEVFRLPDAAARYVAKECGKRCQKGLPEGVKGGRRWWWLSKEGKPKCLGIRGLSHWPLAGTYSRVFEKKQLAPYFIARPAPVSIPAKFAVDSGTRELIEAME